MAKKIFIGLIAGTICGFFGAGGGLILVPAFVYLFKLDEKRARATSIYAILPMVLISGIFYYNANFVDLNIAFNSVIGGIIGAIFGAKLLRKLSSNMLKTTFAIFLVYMGVRMIW